jgi:hypothetical protein
MNINIGLLNTQLARLGANESMNVSWLLVRNQSTREILDGWKVSSPKAALRKAAAVSNAQYPVPILKDYVCLPVSQLPPSVL